MNVLNVGEKVFVDNSISNAEFHTHQPYTTQFGNNDEIRIPIPANVSSLPSRSYLYVEGKLLKDDGNPSTTAKFINNGIAYLFSEIRYEVNGVVVDSVTRVGLTSTMKGYLSYNAGESLKLQNAGWFPDSDSTLLDASGNFSACLPLSMLLGVFEDYGKIMLNIKQELVLIRSNTDVNAIISTSAEEKIQVVLQKIYWRVPYIVPSLKADLALSTYVDRDTAIQVAFRSWETHIYPAIPQTNKHTWSIKTSTGLETPRFIILGFQTGRNGDITKDMSKFDSCNIRAVEVYFNSARYLYDTLNVHSTLNHFSSLYEAYADFQRAYYDKTNESLLSPAKFKTIAPVIVIDCSRQEQVAMTDPVVLMLECHSKLMQTLLLIRRLRIYL
ncbi:hypothetical protein ILUMI_06322 [Ignelater luminosus]|uniref:Double jelly roll-like domain-containing protein n=1 Tax=Ignelater luminosus TaxID=2038154 RepID=A0A8K0D604_IGNLU|nr:hypothetical protein ILUMI_06322 [Ignelater luminosus]